MAKIVLSYRRDDSRTITSWLYEKLVDRYGREAIFRDIDSIQPTENFRKRIGRALRDADFVVAVIGPGWEGKAAEGPSRINSANDWVRVEIETALQLDIPLLPVLVEDAEMPEPDNLPASLREITEINALPISTGSQRFYDDLERLFATIDKVTGASVESSADASESRSARAAEHDARSPPVNRHAEPPPSTQPQMEQAATEAATAAAPVASTAAAPAGAPASTDGVVYSITDGRTIVRFIIVPGLIMSAFWMFLFASGFFNGEGGVLVFLVSGVFMLGLGVAIRKASLRFGDAIIIGAVVGLAAMLASFATGELNPGREIGIVLAVFIVGGMVTAAAGFVLGAFFARKRPA